MASSKQFREPELELAEALTDADRKRGLLRHSPDCSSDKELRLFVAGRSSRPDAILAHLGDCPRCVQLLPRLRARAVRIKQASLALAGIAIIVVAAWLMLIRPAPVPAGIATIDLRGTGLTRGPEASTSEILHVRRTNGTMRIVLPIGSEGDYDCEIRSPLEGAAVASSSGQASVEDHIVILNLPINLGQLAPGRYSLALRRNGSGWTSYRLELK